MTNNTVVADHIPPWLMLIVAIWFMSITVMWFASIIQGNLFNIIFDPIFIALLFVVCRYPVADDETPPTESE